uniref:Uncharacterized protein n=1 Tax=Rhizophora mucronata TaxID=61149 RepID=A0A2P2NEI7_RHIMU
MQKRKKKNPAAFLYGHAEYANTKQPGDNSELEYAVILPLQVPL